MTGKPECILDKNLLNTAKSKEIVQRNSSSDKLEKINNEITYAEFFKRYLQENRLCILASRFTDSWKSRQEWVDETGCPNLWFLDEKFGRANVPVADCGKEEYSSHPKESMTLSSYIDYLRNRREKGQNSDDRCLYLKDWHFTRDFPDYKAYDTPLYFSSDWMNEFWDSQRSINDDYRFIYFGPKGSWTPFHADVFHSFSWSANICGRKKWIFFPPGEEEFLRNRYGKLAYDVTSSELKDRSLYPKYCKIIRQIEVIQEPGEIVFVPSGWYHQVFNMEDTISINHNWLNGCNVKMCWEHIKQSLASVKKEIEDCRGTDDWEIECQHILKAHAGIDFKDFFKFMNFIAENRFAMLGRLKQSESCTCSQMPDIQKQLGANSDGGLNSKTFSRCIVDEQNKCLFNKEHLLFDLLKVKCILQDMKDNPDFTMLEDCPNSLDTLISKIESYRCDYEEI